MFFSLLYPLILLFLDGGPGMSPHIADASHIEGWKNKEFDAIGSIRNREAARTTRTLHAHEPPLNNINNHGWNTTNTLADEADGRSLAGDSGSNIIPLSIGYDFATTFSGFDLLRGFKSNVAGAEKPFKQKVFEGEVYNSRLVTSYVDSKIIEDVMDFRDAMEIGGSIAISFGPIPLSGSGSGTFIDDNVNTDNQMSILYRSRHIAYQKAVEVSSLKLAEGVEALRSTDIAEIYGTKFVEKIYYGAQLDVRYTFMSKNAATLQRIKGELGGKMKIGPLSIRFGADVDYLKKNVDSTLSVSIQSKASGVKFTVPSDPTIAEMYEIIERFNDEYGQFEEESKTRDNVDGNSNILKNFSPVAFALAPISDYLPRLNRFEAAILDVRMNELSNNFFSALYLKSQLLAARDTQRNVYTSAKERDEIYLPYKAYVDNEIAKLDRTIDKCLEYRRLPYSVIVGRDGYVAAKVPDEYPKNMEDEKIIKALFGHAYIARPVTIGTTVFDDYFYEGFAVPSGDDGSLIPWMSGRLKNNEDERVVTTAMTPRELEKNGYAANNGIGKIGFDYVRYGVPVHLQSSGSSSWLIHKSEGNEVTAVNYLPVESGSWIIRSNDDDGNDFDPKDMQCVEYGDTFYLQNTMTGEFISFDLFMLPDKTRVCQSDTLITTEEDCEVAGLALGGRLNADGTISTGIWQHTPCNCFLSKTKLIHFVERDHCPSVNHETEHTYEPICQSHKTSEKTSGSRWRAIGDVNDKCESKCEGKCIQMLSNVYLQNNDQFEGAVTDDIRNFLIGTKSGGEVEMLPEKVLGGRDPQWTFRGNDEIIDGFACGAVSANGKWKRIPPSSTDQKSEESQMVRFKWGMLGKSSFENTRSSPYWRHTASWEQSVVASVSGGFTIMEEIKVDWFYGAMLAKSVEEAIKKKYEGDFIWPHDFRYASAVVKDPTYDCIQIFEGAEPEYTSWHDNYFCWDNRRNPSQDPGFKWYGAGPIDGMKCTLTNEPDDVHAWHDNHLCVPMDSPLDFKWSHEGRIDGLSCIQWYESIDKEGGWFDNYLCAKPTLPYSVESKSMPLGEAWQFVYEIEDTCGDRWELMTDVIATTPNTDEEPCCLPGFEADPQKPHGPCKLSSPCFCEKSICEADSPFLLPIPEVWKAPEYDDVYNYTNLDLTSSDTFPHKNIFRGWVNLIIYFIVVVLALLV